LTRSFRRNSVATPVDMTVDPAKSAAPHANRPIVSLR
jgi:hypothetical protein